MENTAMNPSSSIQQTPTEMVWQSILNQLNKFDTDVNRRFEELNRRFDDQGKRFDAFTQSQYQMREQDKQFHNDRHERADQRFRAIEERNTALAREIDNLRHEGTRFQQEQVNARKEFQQSVVDMLNQRDKDRAEQFAQIEKQIAEVHRTLKNIVYQVGFIAGTLGLAGIGLGLVK